MHVPMPCIARNSGNMMLLTQSFDDFIMHFDADLLGHSRIKNYGSYFWCQEVRQYADNVANKLFI